MTKLEDDYAILAQHRRALEELAESKGWQTFVSYLLQAEEPLQQAILLPLKSPEDVYLREFQKGHRYALRAIVSYPQAFIDDINSAMQAMQVQLATEAVEDENVDQTEDVGAGRRDGFPWDGDADGSAGSGDDGGRERAP